MSLNMPVFKKMSPQLAVADIGRAIKFYTEKLGFRLDFEYEDFYAGIIKDGHSIHLKCGEPRGNDVPPFPEPPEGATAGPLYAVNRGCSARQTRSRAFGGGRSAHP